MARAKRKIRKKRGHRSAGKGSHKKARSDKSLRGGRGFAGSFDHRYIHMLKYYPDRLGKRGFSVPQAVKVEYETINVGVLDEIAEKLVDLGIAEKEGDKIFIDLEKLGKDKVLGSGKVTKPLKIKAKKFTEEAIRKIEEAGGEVVEA